MVSRHFDYSCLDLRSSRHYLGQLNDAAIGEELINIYVGFDRHILESGIAKDSVGDRASPVDVNQRLLTYFVDGKFVSMRLISDGQNAIAISLGGVEKAARKLGGELVRFVNFRGGNGKSGARVA